jgi:hypothetical protein
VEGLQALERRSDLVGVGTARAVALLDPVDRLLARALDRPRGGGLEVGEPGLEAGEGALGAGACEMRPQRGDRLPGLGLERLDLLRRAVLASRSPSST